MAISSLTRKIQTLLFTLLYFTLIAYPRYSLSLNFNIDFTKDDYRTKINCAGNASDELQHCKNLSSDGLTDKSISGSVGKAFYYQPVSLWDKSTGEEVLTSFDTTFSFQIKNITNSTADGLAFFLAPYPPPVKNVTGCGALGLLNISTVYDIPSHKLFKPDPANQMVLNGQVG
ncbi:hypothetical protein LUZ63_013931 [Rhynchospora breviuscula]|uniref:Legume lectin domain-containing protein n=1 Tax=Rhynchospora breviuscula TaxID=2022672 RepID=A0A9Q0C9F7_9POAL|nr:hypothetical protein LUZ63_013931 [Rhynchospora breviuscula]